MRPDELHPSTGALPPPETWPTGRLLSAVARRLERDWNTHLAHWGLNHASFPVLVRLVAGPLSQRELALGSGVTEQTMSRILARLERQEYIARHTNAADRRRHEVHLTDAGATVVFEAGDPVVAEGLTVRGLSPAQVDSLRELLLVMLAAAPDRRHPEPPGTAGMTHTEQEVGRG